MSIEQAILRHVEIDRVLTQYRKIATQLKSERAELQRYLIQYMSSNHLQKAQFKNVMLELKQRTIRHTFNKDEKLEYIKTYLEEHPEIDDARDVAQSILEQLKGTPGVKTVLTLKHLKK